MTSSAGPWLHHAIIEQNVAKLALDPQRATTTVFTYPLSWRPCCCFFDFFSLIPELVIVIKMDPVDKSLTGRERDTHSAEVARGVKNSERIITG